MGLAPHRGGKHGRRFTATVAVLVVAVLGAAALASAAVVQSGNLRITVLGQVKPFRLPRSDVAPIAVFISGHLANTHGGTPPQLKGMTIRVNRRGRIEQRGLPVCRLVQIEPATTSRAMSVCKDALVGSGRFWAQIVLPDQGAYRTRGRLLVFNGRRNHRPVLFAHVFTSNPFATSFVLTFAIHHIAHGRYGTLLTTSLPETLGDWGYLDRIKLTVRRKYTYRGEQRSFFATSCPAPKGFPNAIFSLALVQFSFAGNKHLDISITKSCKVKE
jgi:hypothetical protein